MKPCIFLDRDGILNEVVIRDGIVSSPHTLAEFALSKNHLKLLKAIRAAQYLCIIVTNQPDIGRNKMKLEELKKMHQLLMDTQLIHSIYCESSGATTNTRRKPNPTMLIEAQKDWNIDMSKSYFIGDSCKDIAAGQRAGVKTILLKTTYNLPAHGQATHNFSCTSTIIEYIVKTL